MVERDTRLGGNLELANLGGDAGIGNLAQRQWKWDKAQTEFDRFHAKSDPTAQKWEKMRYEQYDHPELINARAPMIFRNKAWSPNHPGPKFDTRFIVGANKSSEGLRSWPGSEYIEDIGDKNKFFIDLNKDQIRDAILRPRRPGLQAGITHPNLNGYKVMNASDSYERDERRADREYNQEHYSNLYAPYHTVGPAGMDASLIPDYASDFELDMFLESLTPEDLGVEPHLEAQSQWRRPENVEKTIDVLEIRPEFDGWTRDEIKAYIFRSTRQANRGGIIGLL